MGNIRDIKNRIGSIKNTRQITNAMKMVAASKLRKSQEMIINARPYANYIDLMLRTLKLKNKTSEHPMLLDAPKSGKELLVVVTADRGLCGSFNSSIIREALKYIKEKDNLDVVCVGRRGFDYIKKRTKNVVYNFNDIFNDMEFHRSRDIASKLIEEYMSEKYSVINVLFNEFKSAIQQDIKVKQLLPIVPLESDIVNHTDFLYEPDEEILIEELGRKYVDVEIWRILLESSAAEQGARMTAMDNATENASDLIKLLTLQYNRERQAAITTEIIEIASGAEAINK